jgi:hypothetical protein
MFEHSTDLFCRVILSVTRGEATIHNSSTGNATAMIPMLQKTSQLYGGSKCTKLLKDGENQKLEQKRRNIIIITEAKPCGHGSPSPPAVCWQPVSHAKYSTT